MRGLYTTDIQLYSCNNRDNYCTSVISGAYIRKCVFKESCEGTTLMFTNIIFIRKITLSPLKINICYTLVCFNAFFLGTIRKIQVSFELYFKADKYKLIKWMLGN
jgi:hypothetical protein